MGIAVEIAHQVASFIGRVTYVPLFQIDIIPGMATDGIQHTIGIYRSNALRVEHHGQQVGISLTNGLSGLEHRIGVVIDIFLCIADVVGNPFENLVVFILVRFGIFHQFTGEVLDFLVFVILDFDASQSLDGFCTGFGQEFGNILGWGAGRFGCSIVFSKRSARGDNGSDALKRVFLFRLFGIVIAGTA